MVYKKLYLLRHGQTEYNKQGIVQGRGVDSSLNDIGRKQAQKFFQRYHDLPLDWIYISGLKRTKETVAPFLESGIPFTKFDGLDEIHWGSKEGKPFSPEDHEHYRETTMQWQNGNTHIPIIGGESPQQVQYRQQPVLEHLLKQTDQQNIMICMHGRAMRIFLCLLLRYPLQYMDLFPHQNTGLYQLTYTGSLFRVDKANCSGHLNTD